jgi:uncharacterized protein (DUF1330 family)
MAQPIYKVWMMNYTDAWYKLSPEEQNAYGAKVEQALKEVGGERLIVCVSVWSSENYLAWGVEKFPSIEAVQKFTESLLALGQYKYIQSNSYLGTEYQMG